jgi:endonuclease I
MRITYIFFNTMLKSKYISVILFLFSITLIAQVPDGYYDSAKNLADDNLKYQLNQIIDNHTEFSYTSSSKDVWDILKETDRDPNNPDNVILIYSGISVNGAQEYNSANGWTREHIWAKSRGDFGTNIGIGTDVHALRPLDNTTNSIRSNRSFNNCITCEDVTDKWGNTTGSKKDANDWSFEPRDEVKGDVARMMFYMAIRYEGLDSFPDLELTESILPQESKEPIHGVLSTLLEWHRNDPVDTWEENRNNIIYYSYQNNRNPFIDFPELAEHIWGTEIGVNWTGEEVLNTILSDDILLSIFPNPAHNFINVKGLNKSVKIEIYDILGRKVSESQIVADKNKIDVSELKGMYLINIVSQEKIITKFILIE